MENYETARDAATRLGISQSQVRRYCEQERIPGAIKMAERWFVPRGAVPTPAEFGRPQTWTLEDVKEDN